MYFDNMFMLLIIVIRRW